ncbi:MAG: hypothetical protein OEL58_06165 [Desulfobacteraceae bacterium]|nr:hypothetical protein [Desulfobacteraceae bacterium]
MLQTKFSFNYPQAITVRISTDYTYLWLGLLKMDVIKRYCRSVARFIGLLLMIVFPIMVIAGPVVPSGPPPLVVVDATQDMLGVRDETFGPVSFISTLEIPMKRWNWFGTIGMD